MKAVVFPFQLDSFGRIVSTKDSNKIYMDRLLTVLSTMVYDRPIKNNYGTNLARAMYETYNRSEVAIREAIERAIGIFLPEIELESFSITEPNDQGISNVDLSVILPDSTIQSISINTGYFSSNGILLGNV
jgi:phage baseplate assembly protein W